jgi:hypothetical protein
MKTREHQKICKALNKITNVEKKAARKCLKTGCVKCPYYQGQVCFFDVIHQTAKALKRYQPVSATPPGLSQQAELFA